MSYSVLAAIAFVCIIEGILPFAVPNFWRKVIKQVSNQDNRALRVMGFVLMVIGVIILVLAHIFY